MNINEKAHFSSMPQSTRTKEKCGAGMSSPKTSLSVAVGHFAPVADDHKDLENPQQGQSGELRADTPPTLASDCSTCSTMLDLPPQAKNECRIFVGGLPLDGKQQQSPALVK